MTSTEFADMLNNGQQPWRSSWSDSTKEQFFHLLNAEQANELELEQWRLNNEYNTPYNQMARMIEAGINPAAAYQSVSSGNSSSPANVHQSGTAAFHDTSDQLQRVNTIMNGISSIMSTIKTGVDAVEGIQGVQFGYQNNWLNKKRADLGGSLPLYDRAAVDAFPTKDLGFVEVSPGQYALIDDLIAFPEALKAYSLEYGQNVGYGNLSNANDMADRRTRIDKLIQNIFRGLETNASSDEMMRMFLELFAYGAMSKFGGF